MPTKDTSEIKEKILSVLRRRGPSLPVHISGETGMSALFASAFLSELFAEKKIKISDMKVGNSPLYFLPGQEPSLEKFSEHLKNRERDAFELLKEKKFLKDSEQQPAIRVALRSIKDFAIPFKKNEEIFWRYFTVPESEFKLKGKPIKSEKKIKREELDIFDKEIKEKSKIKTPARKKTSQKKNEKFFNKVKEFLSAKSIEIIDIESFNKNELVLRVNKEGEKLLVAYNKKRINENDIVKANKKASEAGLPYIILSLGEPLKKLSILIDALEKLSSIESFK